MKITRLRQAVFAGLVVALGAGSPAFATTSNAAPTVDNDRLYNGGRACTTQQPFATGNKSYGDILQAWISDADEDPLTVEFAVWPQDSGARTVYTQTDRRAGLVGVDLPDTTVTDGTTYGWQARVGDGTATSDWSASCYFTYDATFPPSPGVTSSNYPVEAPGPVGELAEFTFSGAGNADVAGFEYSWNAVGGVRCDYGDIGQYWCPDPFAYDNRVRADQPGGTATVTLNPPGYGQFTLSVWSIDAAGNTSPHSTDYVSRTDWTRPTVTSAPAEPKWGGEVTLTLTPAPGMTGVTGYEVNVRNESQQIVAAGPDGIATFTFVPSNPNGVTVDVRSHSANGYVSDNQQWSATFDPAPGVTADVYPASSEPAGGVGVEGTFTFSPPPGLPDLIAYRYWFNDYEQQVDIAPGPDGRATVTWAPTESGSNFLVVQAIRANGNEYWASAIHQFEVST